MVSLWVTFCGKCHKVAPQSFPFESMGDGLSPLEFAQVPHLEVSVWGGAWANPTSEEVAVYAWFSFGKVGVGLG